MKMSAMDTVGLTTLLLVIVTILASLNFSFSWVFYLTVIGQGLVIYMVYRVLTDKYTTKKTFDDFYEDHPIGRQDQSAYSTFVED